MSMEFYEERAGTVSETLDSVAADLKGQVHRSGEEHPFLSGGDFERGQWMAEHAVSFLRNGTVASKTIDVHETPGGSAAFSFNGDPIFFFQGVAFHPGAQRSVDAKASPVSPVGGSGESRLFIVDTGWLADDNVCAYTALEEFPFHKDDVVRGHGPAIVDVAQTIMGRDSFSRIHLHSPRYFDGSLKAATFLPVVYNNEIKFVRTFDMQAALLTIRELDLRPHDVLNLSFGTTLADEGAIADLEKELRGLIDEIGVRVVAAAGNHGPSTDKSWPAAIHGVVAAGSGGAGGPHDFSARGPWVTHFEDGFEVPLDIPGIDAPAAYPRTANLALREASWTGTSFSAPKIAARLALAGAVPKGGDPLDAVSGDVVDHPSNPAWSQ